MALSQRSRRYAPLALLGVAGIALAGCGAPGGAPGDSVVPDTAKRNRFHTPCEGALPYATSMRADWL